MIGPQKNFCQVDFVMILELRNENIYAQLSAKNFKAISFKIKINIFLTVQIADFILFFHFEYRLDSMHELSTLSDFT